MSRQLTNREKLLHKLRQLTDVEVESLLNYVSLMERKGAVQSERLRRDQRVSQNSPDSDDELLALLSSAYENRRACQVFEWEAARRKSEIKTGRNVL